MFSGFWNEFHVQTRTLRPRGTAGRDDRDPLEHLLLRLLDYTCIERLRDAIQHIIDRRAHMSVLKELLDLAKIPTRLQIELCSSPGRDVRESESWQSMPPCKRAKSLDGKCPVKWKGKGLCWHCRSGRDTRTVLLIWAERPQEPEGL